jgi:hypothetical protein
MLTIRPEQISVLSQAQAKSFENRMLAHLRQFFPKQCEAIDEAKLRETIQYGIRSAAVYGIAAERDVCKYVDLIMVLGRDFDKDEKRPWASRILVGPDGPGTRISVLVETAEKHLRKT